MAELKYEKVKENSEKMATQIFEYIHAAGLTDLETDKLFSELATSFFTSAIHSDTASGAIKEINVNAILLAKYATEGYLKFLAGDNKDVLSDMTDYEGKNNG
jgi:hypothetical protein